DLWKTDGLISELAYDFSNAVNDILAREVYDYDLNQIVMSGNNGSGPVLTNFDGSTANQVPIFSANNNDPRMLTKVGNDFYFLAKNGTSNYELWKSNGLNSGSVLVPEEYFTATGNLNNLK